jgi:hypothetical protein
MSNFRGSIGGHSEQLSLVSVLGRIQVELIMRFKIKLDGINEKP